jgi:hypothetical protein
MERFKHNIIKTEELIRQAMQDCLTEDALEHQMKKKVDRVDYQKQLQAVSDHLDFIDAKVETRIPAMQNELRSGLKQKVNVDDMDVALDKKADKDMLSQVIDRLNKMEEVSQRLASKL